jgi:hypothetical protein
MEGGMGIDEARAMIDRMEANQEEFVRELGGPEVVEWMHQEMRRRREARRAQEAEQKRLASLPVTTTGTSPPPSDSPSSLTLRVEVLEAQLKHLTRRLQRRRVI